jgi:hypothetical protein
MFFITVVLWALDLANFIMEAKLTLIVDSDLPLSTRLADARSFMFPLIAAIDALYAYLVSFASTYRAANAHWTLFVQSLLGDAIILWRVFNLKGYYRPWVFIFPLALLLGSLSTWLSLQLRVDSLEWL